jgi:hypothetical protein
MVGLAGSLGQVFDLVVLDGDLGAEKPDLTVLFVETRFELQDVVARDLSRRLGACRSSWLGFFAAFFGDDSSRDLSRQDAPPRYRQCAYRPMPARSDIFRQMRFQSGGSRDAL